MSYVIHVPKSITKTFLSGKSLFAAHIKASLSWPTSFMSWFNVNGSLMFLLKEKKTVFSFKALTKLSFGLETFEEQRM